MLMVLLLTIPICYYFDRFSVSVFLIPLLFFYPGSLTFRNSTISNSWNFYTMTMLFLPYTFYVLGFMRDTLFLISDLILKHIPHRS